jgi:8-oxo-dGTP pyrophosphatase MutT (NUDIX family)
MVLRMNHPSPQHLTLADVRRALALVDFDVEAAWGRMFPRPARDLHHSLYQEGTGRPASVLVLLYPVEGDWWFVLTRRSEALPNHKGQISLPGGAREPGETLLQTAIRETCEEVGICADEVHLIGALTPLYVSVSDFEIHPFVGYLDERPHFTANPVEVAGLIEMPLDRLVDDSIKTQERWQFEEVERDVPFYRYDGQVIWGATAIILSELEGRLRVARGEQ